MTTFQLNPPRKISCGDKFKLNPQGITANPPPLYCLRSKGCFVSPSPRARPKGGPILLGPGLFFALGRFWRIDFRVGFIDKSRPTGGTQLSKIALLRIDWRLDPPKMASGRIFRKDRKINEQIIEKRTNNPVKIILNL